MIISKEIKVNATGKFAPVHIEATQGETNARRLIVQVLDDNGVVMNLSPFRASLYVTKKDGTVAETMGIVNGTSMYFDLLSQSMAVAGKQPCFIELFDINGVKILRISGLILDVQACRVDNAELSVTELASVKKATLDAIKAAEQADTAGTKAVSMAEEAISEMEANIPTTSLAFTEATSRQTINSGESLSTLFGKIKRWFTDLKAIAFSGSAADITTGTLPLARGGTGATSAAAARNALGLGNTTGPTPIANGGTNSTTAAAAVSNLGAVPTTRTINSKALSANITLNASDVGAAATSHNHSADNITSGTLPIARGGTGGTTVASARNALGLGNATGAIPIANGGTGQTSIAAARNALGLGNTTGAVPVANGGTGATSAAAARTNLGMGVSIRSETWKTGSITIPNLVSNRWYTVRLDGLGTAILVFNTGSWIRGKGGYRADNGNMVDYYFNASVSGTTVTLIACSEKVTTPAGAVTIRPLLHHTVSAIEAIN